MTKHKKLKRKYQTLSADIYVDDYEESHNEQPNNDKQTDDKNLSNDEPIIEQPKNNTQTMATKQIRQRLSWRNQLNYL